MKNKKIKNDLLLAVGFLAAAAVAFAVFFFARQSGETVNVIIDGEKTESYSLSDSMEKEIISENGTNTLVIENGSVYMKSADCPDKICVAHRPVKNKGETIVCLPHRLVLEVE